MRSLLIKIFVVGLIAAVCGAAVGVGFSLCFYGFIPRPWLAEFLDSDTAAAAKLRFWIAFVVGAAGGAVWAYRTVKDLKL